MAGATDAMAKQGMEILEKEREIQELKERLRQQEMGEKDKEIRELKDRLRREAEGGQKEETLEGFSFQDPVKAQKPTLHGTLPLQQ